MSPEVQRLELARMCPNVAFFKNDGIPYWREKMEPAYDSDCFTHCEFDPLDDLNAIDKIERCLTPIQKVAYREKWLWYVYWRGIDVDKIPIAAPIDATAAQRAEAILRAADKWDDSL